MSNASTTYHVTNAAIRAEVLRLHALGVGPLSIAVRVGCTHAHVLRVVNGLEDKRARLREKYKRLGPGKRRARF